MDPDRGSEGMSGELGGNGGGLGHICNTLKNLNSLINLPCPISVKWWGEAIYSGLKSEWLMRSENSK